MLICTFIVHKSIEHGGWRYSKSEFVYDPAMTLGVGEM